MSAAPAKLGTDVEEYLRLLLAYRALPQLKTGQTVMEVSGYPHFENVCSNILAFYFNPAEEHGLKDLLLTAFIRMAGKPEVEIRQNVSPIREYYTASGNRLDVLMDCETFTIGIENKIYHGLHNDLVDYAKVIDGLGKGKSVVIKAVLGLKPIEDKSQLKGGFVSYTYGQLWSHVRDLLGQYLAAANPKWVTYLMDFMQTTTNLAGENMELKQTDQFFIDHHEELEKMLAERSAFLNRLVHKLKSLAELMKDVDQAKNLSKVPWVYQGQCVVLDYKFGDNCLIAFDVQLNPLGWEVQFFARDRHRSRELLSQFIQQPSLKSKMAKVRYVNDRYVLENWDLQTDLALIKNALCVWMDALVDASKAELKKT